MTLRVDISNHFRNTSLRIRRVYNHEFSAVILKVNVYTICIIYIYIYIYTHTHTIPHFQVFCYAHLFCTFVLNNGQDEPKLVSDICLTETGVCF